MKNFHKIELVVVETNDAYGVDTILENFNRSINGISMSSSIFLLNSESKKVVWYDEIPLNFKDVTPLIVRQFFDNVDNDEYQQYLKLKEKFEK